MSYLFGLLVIVLVLGALQFLVTKRGASRTDDCYHLSDSLFTPAERSFLGVLDGCLLDGYRVMAKVRLADIFGVRRGLGRGRWQSAFNRISAKHIDFLLIRESDCAPILGIELDDRSHGEPARQERDAFVDGVFRGAGLPLLHIPARRGYDHRELRRQIEAAIRPEQPASTAGKGNVWPGAGVA